MITAGYCATALRYICIVSTTAILLSLSLFGYASDIEPVILIEDNSPFDLRHHTEYLIEPRDGPLQHHDRLGLPQLTERYQRGVFKPVVSHQIGFGAQWSVIHLRIPLANPTQHDQTWILAFNRWAGLFNEVYLALDGEPLPIQPLAQTQNLIDWKANDILYHTSLPLPSGSKGAIYVSYSNGSSAAPLTIETESSYHNRRRIEDIHLFSIIAMTLGIGVLVAMQKIALGQRAAYFYIAYLGFGILWIVNNTEYLYRPYLFGALPWINSVDVILWGMSFGFLFLFQRAFLVKSYCPQWWRTLLLICAAYSMIGPYLMLVADLRHHSGFILTGAVLLLLPPISGLVAIRYLLPGGWPFFFGALTVSIAAVGYMLAHHFSHTVRMVDAHYFVIYAYLFEAILFALAIFRQTTGIREEREKALQAELEATRDKLKLHEQLVSTAHDLHQPLTALKMASRLPTLSGAVDSSIIRTVDYLEEIVRNNLSTKPTTSFTTAAPTAREDADHGNYHVDEEKAETFEVNLILQNVTAMFQEEAQAKGLSLKAIASSQPVYTSPLVLMRIVSNLVSNSIRNTDKGKILLGCRRLNAGVRIEVHDTGCGMTPEKIRTLLLPYQREGEYEGTGLGLSIVHQLCNRHGFSLNIQSTPGQGSVFSISVPGAVSPT